MRRVEVREQMRQRRLQQQRHRRDHFVGADRLVIELQGEAVEEGLGLRAAGAEAGAGEGGRGTYLAAKGRCRHLAGEVTDGAGS